MFADKDDLARRLPSGRGKARSERKGAEGGKGRAESGVNREKFESGLKKLKNSQHFVIFCKRNAQRGRNRYGKGQEA